MFDDGGTLSIVDADDAAGSNFRAAIKLDVNSRISLSNNDAGTSNTIFGKSAGLAIASGGNYNICIGEEAGHDITTADNSVVVGYQANDKASASVV